MPHPAKPQSTSIAFFVTLRFSNLVPYVAILKTFHVKNRTTGSQLGETQFLGKGATTLPSLHLTFRRYSPTTENHNKIPESINYVWSRESSWGTPNILHPILSSTSPSDGALLVVLKLCNSSPQDRVPSRGKL